MASRSQLPGEKAHAPYTPSPLNPIITETSPRRQKRRGQHRGLKHEQSPTQILMRQKAATAWRSIPPQNTTAMNHAGTIHGEADVKTRLIEQTKDSSLVHPSAEWRSMAFPAKGLYAEKGARHRDMEKQALAGDHEGDYPPEINYLLDLLTTRRLILTVGILVTLGVFLIMRALGRIQTRQA